MKAARPLLTAELWAALSPLLPGQAGCGGVRARDRRGFVAAVRWLGRPGVPWRELPPPLGHWHRVYVRFARWRAAGVWEKASQGFRARQRKLPRARQRPVPRDSTSGRVHPHGTGAANQTASRPWGGGGAGARATYR